jgi:hypothetical protein
MPNGGLYSGRNSDDPYRIQSFHWQSSRFDREADSRQQNRNWLSRIGSDRPKFMSVFVGWSGKDTRSHQVAEALRRWLEQVIQGCEPWVSTVDIDAGERWGLELFAQLQKLPDFCVADCNSIGLGIVAPLAPH